MGRESPPFMRMCVPSAHCVGAPFSQAFGGDDTPANYCNGPFRVGDKSKRVPVRRLVKQYIAGSLAHPGASDTHGRSAL